MFSTTYEFLAAWVSTRFADGERGASLVEYALLVALIAIVCVAAVAFFGGAVSDCFSKSGSRIP
jgi:pilus assembly protein Flp/PilA